MTIRIAVSAAALLGLAACGGGDGGIGGGFAALDAEYDALLDNFSVGTSTGTGVVDYSGVMLVANSLEPGSASSEGYMGSATMSMNFTSGDFEGDADGFYLVSIDPATGLPNGIITSVNPDGSVSSTNVTFDDTGIVDEFFTPVFTGSINGDALAGEGAGTFRDPDGTTVTIVETNGASGFTLDGVASDVNILGD